ncbi:MAG TPA: dicarboxylate/amino acid:cation symporter, partial [Chitinophagaceae bacterium]|nr:dicarboxylate/amino acid:cation symporter [Chitinophagaceae bacterium]
MKKRNLPLHIKIIIGMVLGVLIGLLFSRLSWGSQWILSWIKPFGDIFINLLKLLAIPLIFASLVSGIAQLKDISKLSKIGFRTILWFLSTTVLAVSIGLLIVNIIKPGKFMSEETRSALIYNYKSEANSKIVEAQSQESSGPLQFLQDIIPENIFAAASENTNMLQVIFFAIFLGISMIMISEKKSKPVREFFVSLNDIILEMINLVMRIAPLGVFALLAALVVEAPSGDLFIALLSYALTVVLGLFLLLIIYVLLIWLFGKVQPREFFKAMMPAQLLAFSTSSSAATLPVTMDCVEKGLKVDKEISSFVIPIGATINMDGTSLYQAVAAIFIAQAFDMDLNFMQQLSIVVTAVLASIGSAAVPSAGIIMIVIILNQVGIPEAGLALIFAIDRPLDMLRTT